MKLLQFVSTFAIAVGISQASPIAGISITGTTLGCFGVACTPVGVATVGGFSFTGGSFNGQTDINGEFAPGVTGNNLGVYSLNGTNFNYGTGAGTPFTMQLILTNPLPGLPGGKNFAAQITGAVSTNTNGTLSVTWPGICHGCGAPVFLYNFSIPQGNGNISVHINPVSFSLSAGNPGPQTAIQDGHFHTDMVATPEPSAVLLVMGGILAFAMIQRTRRHSGPGPAPRS